jgi:hypothetical protein
VALTRHSSFAVHGDVLELVYRLVWKASGLKPWGFKSPRRQLVLIIACLVNITVAQKTKMAKPRMIKKEVTNMRFVISLIGIAICTYVLLGIIAIFVQHPPW